MAQQFLPRKDKQHFVGWAKKDVNNHLSSHSFSEIDDDTLRRELTRRGYNVTRQEEKKTTAKIVKIG